jgi:deoxycytidine triphosphate deaminase
MTETNNSESAKTHGIPTGDQLKQLASAMGSDLPTSQIGVDAIDIKLDDRYRRLCRRRLGLFRRRIDIWSMKCDEFGKLDQLWPMKTMPMTGIWIKPGEVVIGVSVEEVIIPKNHIGIVIGRATYSRLGLSVCIDIAKIQAGRKGRIHLQLVNHNSVPIRILPHMRIAQLILLPITSSYTLDEHQWSGQSVHPPPYQINLERELAPCVKYALIKMLEQEGVLKENIEEEASKRISSMTSFIEGARELGILPRQRKPIRLSRNWIVVLRIVISGGVVGLVEGLVRESMIGWSGVRAYVTMGIAVAAIATGIILLVKFGRYDSEGD